MRLGIDFGTTRIAVAAVDRGNYPLVHFESPDGDRCDWFPPLVAIQQSSRLYGWEAWGARYREGVTIIRSLKRYMEDAGPESQVSIASRNFGMLDLLTELLASLRENLINRSSLDAKRNEKLEIMIGVPANANGNQRFLTVEAFRRAGFDVLGLLNEPSAAAIEFTHANRARLTSRRRASILVYDLGGGTFDASLVNTGDQLHSVVASEGIPTLGGDDFDTILAELAMDEAALDASERDQLTQSEWFRLHEECRQKKEALHPNTRRLAIDLEAVRATLPPVTVPVATYYEQCRPLVDETINAVQDLLSAHGAQPDTIYVTGGGSEIPLVPRALRKVYGRRVRRSAYTHSATAIGLAIQADEQAGYQLKETVTRHFGVWREADGGSSMIFDPLFHKGTPLPGLKEPALTVERRYHPVHNIGHFRYLECAHRAEDGRPLGGITFWDEILFPFDPVLRKERQLRAAEVGHCERAMDQEIRETYSCDPGGAVTVRIANLSSGYHRNFRLGRWAVPSTPIIPGKRTAAAKKKTRR